MRWFCYTGNAQKNCNVAEVEVFGAGMSTPGGLGGELAALLLLGGGAYAEAAAPFRWFLLYALLLPLDRFLGLALDALGRPHLNTVKVGAIDAAVVGTFSPVAEQDVTARCKTQLRGTGEPLAWYLEQSLL